MAAEALTDQEIEDLDDTWEEESIWNPEPEIDFEEEPILQERAKAVIGALPSLLPSQFTAHSFWMPKTQKWIDEDGEERERVVMDRFTFEGRRHMQRCYDTPAKRLLLFCGRQVEKSTLLGNIMLSYMALISGYKALYVSPSMTQTKTFSADRIKEPLETSPVLKRFTTTMLSQNVLEKQFVNRSKLTMRYAYLNADRTRGIPSYLLALDEFQDILQDNVPVIEQCLSHAPKSYKRQIYAGTPKSLDNHFESYRANKSTMGEWVVPCEGCNNWNILGEKNIGKNFLICERCGKQINPMGPRAQWANQVDIAPWESYRIPQLMVPWLDWKRDIIYNYENYSREKFYNEVLGLSYDSGLRPLTTGQIKNCCVPGVRMSEAEMKRWRQLSFSQAIYGGLDHGTGEHSYTVFVLGTYVETKFRIIYAHRFTGEEVDPEKQIAMILELIRYLNVKLIGSDYGGGFANNYKLKKELGHRRIKEFQYIARGKQKIVHNPKIRRFAVSRTEVMSDVFNAIKRGKLEFPEWDVWKDPFAQDMLNIFSEYNETIKMIQYKHGADKPDDTFHAVVYCLLASMFEIPRPDIIAPDQEDAHGFNKPQWNGGTVDQG